MANTDYTRLNVTSRDLAIIRQHFSNDEIIGLLWKNREDKEFVGKVSAWLWEMVVLTLEQPSEEIKNKLLSVYKSPRILLEEEREAAKDKEFNDKMASLKNPPF
jgi:hypothetical protein